MKEINLTKQTEDQKSQNEGVEIDKGKFTQWQRWMNKKSRRMSSIDIIKAPIKKELKEFEPFYKDAVQTKIPMLDSIMHYILRRKGKMMRPIMVFLTAGLHGKITERSYHAALTIELLHTATLVHDDVVDESYQRRGAFSINAIWKNKVAVLVGDFILGKGMVWCVDHKEYEFLHHISESVTAMSEGEILQIEKARKLDITRETYFEIIGKKTASLLATSAAVGTCSATENQDIIDKMKLMGRYAGIAFQIKDDLFDYQQTNLVGKPTGNDIQERKMTLPLIYAMEQSDKSTQKKIYKLLRKRKKSSTQVESIVDFVKDKGGLEFSEQMMEEYRDKALAILNEYPDSEYKTALDAYIHYITTRKK